MHQKISRSTNQTCFQIIHMNIYESKSNKTIYQKYIIYIFDLITVILFVHINFYKPWYMHIVTPHYYRNRSGTAFTEINCNTTTDRLTIRCTRPVTYQPRKAVGERLFTLIPRFSCWRLRVGSLVEVPIGSQENAKTWQVNKW